MPIKVKLNNLDDWYRAGRGNRLCFYATTDEIQGWLDDYLLPEYRPYRLLTRGGVDVPRARDALELMRAAILECEV